MSVKKIFITATMVFLSLTAFTACGENEAGQYDSQIIKVNAEKVKTIIVPVTFEFSGTVEGVDRVKLSTKLMGEIMYLPLEAGTKVSKGQLLVKIRSADIIAKKQQIKANLLQAEAGFRNVEINYNRVKSLFDKKSATQKEMEDIQMHYDMAAAQVKAVKEMEKEINDVLSYSEIKAPFDGYVVNKYFEEGDIAAPGHPIIIVENFDEFKIVATVSASEINKFEKGNSAKIKIDAVNDHTYEGKIIEINPGGNPASRQFQVQVIINSDERIADIKSGMYAKMILENSNEKLIAVNKNFLVKRGQLTGIYTINGNSEALLRWVRCGKDLGESIEIISGLSEGDQIITTENVKEGQRVEVL